MSPPILLLEDDPAIARTVVFALEREGFAVRHATTLGEATLLAAAEPLALAVLDIGLPDGSGLELCRQWRAAGVGLPIIMLSARGEEIDRVVGLEIGADDYLPKPFSPRELVARVRALLRRAALPVATELAPAPSPGLTIDATGYTAHFNGQALPLTRLEFLLLDKLVHARGRVLTREALLASVWDAEAADVGDRTVDTHIKTLRAKLREAGLAQEAITTLRGIGYSWKG